MEMVAGKSPHRDQVDILAGAIDRSDPACNMRIRIDKVGRFQAPACIPPSASIESHASWER
jgi:hypothetical protein